MTEKQKTSKPLRPPRFNGPAFLVFGIMIVALGLSIDGLIAFVVLGAGIMALGVYGIWTLKRYEKAEGIEETLPGGGRYNAKNELKDEE